MKKFIASDGCSYSIQQQLNILLNFCRKSKDVIYHFEIRQSDNCVFAHTSPYSPVYITIESILQWEESYINDTEFSVN